jgi:hypothetical protein
VYGWDAIQVDERGNRVATWLSKGIRPPAVGDRMLLFLDPAEASPEIRALVRGTTENPRQVGEPIKPGDSDTSVRDTSRT